MLDNDKLKKAMLFQQELLKLQFIDKVDFTFAQKTMELLDTIFGYDTIMMAHLYARTEPVLVPDFQMHNVDMKFAEELYIRNADDKDLFGITFACDKFMLSNVPNYKQSSLYKQVFHKYGYEDCIIKFIRYPDNDSYMSYIVLVSRNGLFADSDIEILDELGPSIAQAFANALKLFDVTTRYSVFKKAVSNFPVGIMLIEKINRVVFSNDVAQKYMKELGVSDPVFYSTFYTNKIFPYYQTDVFGYKKPSPLRIKNFIFNVIPTGNEGSALNRILETENHNLAYSTKDITDFAFVESCVYIIRDEVLRKQGSQEFYEAFNFTKREREIAELMLNGLSNSDIADKLVISFNTVKIHVSNIYKKVKVSNRIDFVNMAQQYRLEN